MFRLTTTVLLYLLYLISYLTSITRGQAIQCGNRPTQLINVEIQCNEEVKTGFLERVEHTAKGFFEKAKQQLGIKSESKIEPRKCEYYKCMFGRLGMLNQLGLPDLSLVQEWINNAVDEKNRNDLNSEVATCFRLMATSAFNIQNDCETASHLMMCMHTADNCEVFKFP